MANISLDPRLDPFVDRSTAAATLAAIGCAVIAAKFGSLLLHPRRLWRSTASFFARWKILLCSTVDKEMASRSIRISGIYTHPVKSLKEISLQKSQFDSYGLSHDRQLMIVAPLPIPLKGFFAPDEATYGFVTQRQVPLLARICATLETSPKTSSSYLVLSFEDHLDSSTVVRRVTVNCSPHALAHAKTFRARIWDDVVSVADVGDEAADFLKGVMASTEEGNNEVQAGDVRLVAIDRHSYKRMADEKYTPIAVMVEGISPAISLTDEYPILITSESSLELLNTKLAEKGKNPISMSQFRPNIVLRGTEPFEEDIWRVIRIGKTVFYTTMCCARCKQSCVNQTTGEVSDEPLTTMSDFRKLDGKQLYFGIVACVQVHSKEDTIHVGDNIEVLVKGEPLLRIH